MIIRQLTEEGVVNRAEPIPFTTEKGASLLAALDKGLGGLDVHYDHHGDDEHYIGIDAEILRDGSLLGIASSASTPDACVTGILRTIYDMCAADEKCWNSKSQTWEKTKRTLVVDACGVRRPGREYAVTGDSPENMCFRLTKIRTPRAKPQQRPHP